jgi:hypothetical protein
MDTPKKIRASFKKLQSKIKSAKDISEEDLRVAFVKSGILEVLGYEGELKDVRFEKGVRGKRSDLLAFDLFYPLKAEIISLTPLNLCRSNSS